MAPLFDAENDATYPECRPARNAEVFGGGLERTISFKIKTVQSTCLTFIGWHCHLHNMLRNVASRKSIALQILFCSKLYWLNHALCNTTHIHFAICGTYSRPLPIFLGKPLQLEAWNSLFHWHLSCH